MPRRRNRRLALLTVAPAVVALALAAPAIASGGGVDLGSFAGYVSDGAPIDSLSATFTVPRIRPHSTSFSFAGTWIGAQAAGVNAPFIQVGVTETHTEPLPAPLRAQHLHSNIYTAFWSDTRLRFRAIPLFGVRPGDVIAASLRRRHDGWTVAIVDATSRRSARFHTRDEASNSFNWAEFLQEDPSSSVTHRPVAYPRLSGVRFRQLLVNSVPPRRRARSFVLSQWMTTARGDVGPGPLSGDAFTLRRQHLGAAATKFWRIALPEDAATGVFVAAMDRWGATTTRAEISLASGRFARALRANARELAGAHWRRRLLPLVDALIRGSNGLLRVVERAPAQATGDLAGWRASFYRAGARVSAAGYRLRTRLRGPALG